MFKRKKGRYSEKKVNKDRKVISYEDVPLEDYEQEKTDLSPAAVKKIIIGVVIALVAGLIVFAFANRDKLTPENISKIVETYANRAETAHFSHLASYDEVAENDYNLSVSTYVEPKDNRPKIDIPKPHRLRFRHLVCNSQLHRRRDCEHPAQTLKARYEDRGKQIFNLRSR